MHFFLHEGQLTLDFFDIIGRRFFGDGITADEVARVLVDNPSDSIRIRINSPGGSVIEGNAISHLLTTDARTVSIEIVGLAASMAAGVTTIGDSVSMSETGDFMIHNPAGLTWGDERDHTKSAARLKSIKDKAIISFVRRTGLTTSEISDMMDVETWMTAEEAKAKGFIHSIIKVPDTTVDPTASLSTDSSNSSASRIYRLFAKFRNAPPHITSCAISESDTAVPLNSLDILKALGLDENSSLDDIRKGFVPKADYLEATVKLACQVQTEKDRLEAEKIATAERFNASVDLAVDTARSQGKVAPSSVEYHKRSIKAIGSDDGLSQFLTTYGAQAATLISQDDQTARHRRGSNSGTGLTSEDKKVIIILGLTEEDYMASAADIHQDPDIYEPTAYVHVPNFSNVTRGN